MKIRCGFVSNSSSTSFTFCYKGEGIKALTDLILTKYRGQFERSYDEWHCNAMDVVESIETSSKNKSEWYKVEAVHIDKVIENEQTCLDTVIQDLEEEKEDYWKRYNLDRKQELENKIARLKRIKERGLVTVLIMDFGDNHGAVQGGNVGYAMDYDGRYIDIDKQDLVVFTEQNR